MVFYLKVHAKARRAKKAMKQFAEVDPSWDYKDFQKRIEDIFFAVQNAWMERNQDIAKDFMSQSLYEDYSSRSQWMIIRHEKNILRNMRIIEALPVFANDLPGDANDVMWVYLKAKMIDYTVDDCTMQITDGSTASKSFVEYWKLIKENDRWVLDEIRQKNEFDLNLV